MEAFPFITSHIILLSLFVSYLHLYDNAVFDTEINNKQFESKENCEKNTKSATSFASCCLEILFCGDTVFCIFLVLLLLKLLLLRLVLE